jgi:CheY-like chemotaxis protein
MVDAIERILMLEDTAAVRRLTKRQLESFGYEVEVAEDYEQAINALEGQGDFTGLEGYDALLLDMDIPGKGNGADVAIRARERDYKGKIIMYSGGDMNAAKEKTADLEKISYLDKPADPKEKLYAAIQNAEVIGASGSEGGRIQNISPQLETDDEIKLSDLGIDDSLEPEYTGEDVGIFDTEDIVVAAREKTIKQQVNLGDRIINTVYRLKFW